MGTYSFLGTNLFLHTHPSFVIQVRYIYMYLTFFVLPLRNNLNGTTLKLNHLYILIVLNPFVFGALKMCIFLEYVV